VKSFPWRYEADAAATTAVHANSYAAEGSLFLWFASTPTLLRAAELLRDNSLQVTPFRSCLQVRFGPHGLEDCLLLLGAGLGEAEARRARALVVLGGEPPALDDFGRITSLHELHVAVQTDWLLGQFQSGGITSHFHPIVHAGDTSRVFAHEALLRGRGRDGLPLQPLAILQRAREAGLYQELDLAACCCAIRESANLAGDVTVFVNFSPAMMDDAERSLKATVAAIDAAGLAPQRFVFEVIEADRIEDAEHLDQVLDCYRRDGFRVALDDLGAGWSTLNLVHRLHPDFIKLDRELIKGVHEDRVKDLIASKLLEIGHGLGIQTIVEGVEQPQELEWARQRGADFVQGFLIAKPGPSTRVVPRA
jgi:EAL domain-containing protein (putative c-di-GMP-specific phosphodiesterase class I)